MGILGELRNSFMLLNQRPSGTTNILDYSYFPFALGDTITWMVNSAVLQRESKLPQANLFVVLNPDSSLNPLQPHLDHSTAAAHLNQLSEVLNYFPGRFQLHFLRSRGLLNVEMIRGFFHRVPSWPSFFDHHLARADYNSHKLINRHYYKHKDIPRLRPTQAQTRALTQLERRLSLGSGYALINIRQRHLSFNQSVLKRDSPMAPWIEFFEQMAVDYPDFKFVLAGQYLDWPRELARLRNLVIPRTHGLGLADEILLLLGADCFMGTSSGFAAAATFSETPYLITNYEAAAAKATEIEVGASCYPFALPAQNLSWERETKDILVDWFRRHNPKKPSVPKERRFRIHGELAK